MSLPSSSPLPRLSGPGVKPVVPLTTLAQMNVPQLPFGQAMPAMFTKEEIARHDKKGDCWVIIDGKVIDISRFMVSHPGGLPVLMPYAGTDATARFTSLHGPSAAKTLQPMIIGGVKLEARY